MDRSFDVKYTYTFKFAESAAFECGETKTVLHEKETIKHGHSHDGVPCDGTHPSHHGGHDHGHGHGAKKEEHGHGHGDDCTKSDWYAPPPVSLDLC